MISSDLGLDAVDVVVRTGHCGWVDGSADHWDGVYSSPSATCTWFEDEPTISLRLLDKSAAGPSAAIVDVGAGASMLVDCLVERGFLDVTVLDISAQALDVVGRRLGERASRVTFVRREVGSWQPERRYDVWHDRAAFHFLTEPSQRACYVSRTEAAVRSDGVLIVATFAEDGPTRCSGLAVARYGADDLAGAFGAGSRPVHCEREAHHTPGGGVQPFTWVMLRRQ